MEQNDALQPLAPEARVHQDQDATLQPQHTTIGTLQAIQQRLQTLGQGHTLGQQQERGQELGL